METAISSRQIAAEAVNDIEVTGYALCAAIAAEKAAVRARNEHHGDLVASLIGNTNPMTNKPHSATSAAAAAEQDPTYIRLDAERDAREQDTINAWATHKAAQLRARLAVLDLEAEARG